MAKVEPILSDKIGEPFELPVNYQEENGKDAEK